MKKNQKNWFFLLTSFYMSVIIALTVAKEQRHSFLTAQVRKEIEQARCWKKNERLEIAGLCSDDWLHFFSVFYKADSNQFNKNRMLGSDFLWSNHYPSGYWNNHGEFDPGSERTLAARLKHASRAGDGSLLPLRAADWWVTRGWRTLRTGIAPRNRR